MYQILFFSILGYLSGSVLYGQVWGHVLKKDDIFINSNDKNPGTSNAYMHGGFWCGTLTLICDLLKGCIPVQMFLLSAAEPSVIQMGLGTVMAAPVIGHAFPLFFRFQGGKGIASTFGCLLGLFPMIAPVGSLVISFLFFSLILKISPHFYRTITAYAAAFSLMLLFKSGFAVCTGFIIIMAVVCLKLFTSSEDRERMRIQLLWMR